jgi:hypothetical protein
LNLVDIWPFGAIRRNHALEHATIHVLSERLPNLRVAGRSDWDGFTLLGRVPTSQVEAAVSSALQRLRAGEGELAIHPYCGTNLATGLTLASLASLAALRGRRRPWWVKLLQLAVGLSAVLIVAQPLGGALQERWTTSSDIRTLRVAGIRRRDQGALVMHRVQTDQG